MRKAGFPIAVLLGCVPACGDGGAGALCYSPTSNLSTAYQPGAVGCSCNPATDRDVCLQGVALICRDGRWHAVEDGPCMPQFPGDAGPDQSSAGPDWPLDVSLGGDVSDDAADVGSCYGPTTDLSTVYQPGAVGCACDHAVEPDVCVRGVGLMCLGGRWTAVIDGPCMPLPPRDAANQQADAVDAPIDSQVRTDAAGDISPAGQVCGSSTCRPGEFCVPGCIGTCRCTPMPDSGTCPNGPCTCGALVGCNYVPPSYCSPTVPVGCARTDAGAIQCTCA
jgi:hypothetical protein